VSPRRNAPTNPGRGRISQRAHKFLRGDTRPPHDAYPQIGQGLEPDWV